LEGYEVMGIF